MNIEASCLAAFGCRLSGDGLNPQGLRWTLDLGRPPGFETSRESFRSPFLASLYVEREVASPRYFRVLRFHKVFLFGRSRLMGDPFAKNCSMLVLLRAVLLILFLFVSLPAAAAQPVPFVRGDADVSGEVDISDGIFILSYVFFGVGTLECPKAADVNGDGRVDVSDTVYAFSFVLLGGRPPPTPYPECGLPRVEFPIECDQFVPCDPHLLVSVSWEPPLSSVDGSGLEDLYGYNIYYGPRSRDYDYVLDVGFRTSSVIYPLPTRSQPLYFSVTAYDYWGNESAFSVEVVLPALP